MGNRKFSRIVLTILIVSMLMMPFASFASAADDYETLDIHLKVPKDLNLFYIKTVMEYIKYNYPFDVTDDQLYYGAIKGMLNSLDEYSDYYTPEEAKVLLELLAGEYGGVGAYIGEEEGYIKIISVIEDSPAEKAGLRAGDKIVSIDGNDIKDVNVDAASKMLKGKPDTSIKLGILREGKDEPIYINVTREIIRKNPIQYKIIDKKIGYIYIEQFSPNTSGYLKKVLDDMDKKDIKKLIVDVRNNPGGYLDEAVEVSRFFVPKGPIVHIRHKNGEIITHTSTLEKPKYDLVVLVNGNSASASEIFAGAIKDRRAGTLVGSKTFGKGIVQSVIPLKDGSIIKMTTAEYLTPNKISIHKKGIEPDIEIYNLDDKDLQLQKAIEILK